MIEYLKFWTTLKNLKYMLWRINFKMIRKKSCEVKNKTNRSKQVIYVTLDFLKNSWKYYSTVALKKVMNQRHISSS